MKAFRAVSGLILSIGLVTPLGFYAKSLSQRPPQTAQRTKLFDGIEYERRYQTRPYPSLLHILTLDLTTPRLEPFVTPSKIDSAQGTDTQARTASEFLNTFQLQLAVNAAFFSPFEEKTPWDYYPHPGDPTDAKGEFISNGDRYSVEPLRRPTLCFKADKTAVIVVKKLCPDQTMHAVSGDGVLFPIPHAERHRQRPFAGDKPYPRTIAAIDPTGTKLWLIVADGKQPHYSEGLLRSEAEHLLAELGAKRAVNLDGGGSVTLVYAKQQQARLLNAPIHTKWPMTERPVANHLGFYALQLPSP